jgi:hypothetical protein
MSASDGRVASMENPSMNAAMRATGSNVASS